MGLKNGFGVGILRGGIGMKHVIVKGHIAVNRMRRTSTGQFHSSIA